MGAHRAGACHVRGVRTMHTLGRAHGTHMYMCMYAAQARIQAAVQEAETQAAAQLQLVKAQHNVQIRSLLVQLDGVESRLNNRIERVETVNRVFSAATRLRGAPSQAPPASAWEGGGLHGAASHAFLDSGWRGGGQFY